jgi:crotonobetainyl-CoA:carnitine CoA-transferase CaiB-like acyl-CoA transferase
MALPLAGVKVIDLTAGISGPLCSYHLALMGANVIKVEVPEVGDIARGLGPDETLNKKRMGVSFWALNAGKRSITLNLKHERGRAVLRRMLKDADVVVENYKPGTLKSFGFGYEAMKEINPRLIYCAISGFGQQGPLADKPSYDQIIQGLSGIMAVTGSADNAPTRAGYVVCDTMVSVEAAFAISAALYRQQKTGKGEMIDVSMLDATLATMPSWLTSAYLNAGKKPLPLGNDNPASSPSGTFRTGTGPLNIVCNDNKQFSSLCDTIGRPQLKTDARFVERPLRVKNRTELTVALEEALAAKSAEEWDRLLTEAHVPAGLILTLPEALAHPQIESREFIKRFKGVKDMDRDMTVTRLGFRLSEEQPDTDLPPPCLGEHTDSVLAEYGYSADEIAELKKAKVI